MAQPLLSADEYHQRLTNTPPGDMHTVHDAASGIDYPFNALCQGVLVWAVADYEHYFDALGPMSRQRIQLFARAAQAQETVRGEHPVLWCAQNLDDVGPLTAILEHAGFDSIRVECVADHAELVEIAGRLKSTGKVESTGNGAHPPAEPIHITAAPRTRDERAIYVRQYGCHNRLWGCTEHLYGCPDHIATLERSTLVYVDGEMVDEVQMYCATCDRIEVVYFRTRTDIPLVAHGRERFGSAYGPSELMGHDDWELAAEDLASLGTIAGLEAAIAAFDESLLALSVAFTSPPLIEGEREAYAESLRSRQRELEAQLAELRDAAPPPAAPPPAAPQTTAPPSAAPQTTAGTDPLPDRNTMSNPQQPNELSHDEYREYLTALPEGIYHKVDNPETGQTYYFDGMANGELVWAIADYAHHFDGVGPLVGGLDQAFTDTAHAQAMISRGHPIAWCVQKADDAARLAELIRQSGITTIAVRHEPPQ